MEKHANIARGTTPPEDKNEGEKRAVDEMSLTELEQDPTKRLADHATECCGGKCHEDPAA